METPPNLNPALKAERLRLDATIEELDRSPGPAQETRLRALRRRRAALTKAEEKNARAQAKAQAKQESPELREARAHLAAWSLEIQRINNERQAAGAEYCAWQRRIIELKRPLLV